MLYTFVIGFFSFFIVMLKMGVNFPHHGYYIIPFVPIMALIAGYGLSNINYKKLSLILLVLICAEGVLNRLHDFIIPAKNLPLLALEQHLNSVSTKDGLIAINSGSSSTPMYFAHRKGWSPLNKEIIQKEYITVLQNNGLKVIVILKTNEKTKVKIDLSVAFENEYYCIYKL